MATCIIEVGNKQPNVQTHTLHTVTLTCIGKSAWGGGAPPPPSQPPTPTQAQPSLAAKLAPQSPCISRCHLNACSHLHLSPSNPTPGASPAKPSQAMLPTPPVKSPCIFDAPSKCIRHVVSEKRVCLCLKFAKNVSEKCPLKIPEKNARSFLSMFARKSQVIPENVSTLYVMYVCMYVCNMYSCMSVTYVCGVGVRSIGLMFVPARFRKLLKLHPTKLNRMSSAPTLKRKP